MIDMEGDWGWFNISSKDKLIEIVEKLKQFETMTWGEIDRNRQSHNITVDRIPTKVKQRLKECKLDDLDTLYSLRLSGRERLWGNRDNEAFYIIWWDPNHTVYPVKK